VAALKLPKLPDRTPVKIAITVTPDLDSLLRDYLALYQAAYDDTATTVADLIPAIIAQFLEGDRAFRRQRNGQNQA
jgi:hypothetical protein